MSNNLDDSFIGSIRLKLAKVNKEWFGVNYLIYSPARLLISLSTVFFTAILFFFYNTNAFDGSIDSANKIKWDLYNDFAFGLNFALSITIWYFVIYMWNQIHKNGDYGYWISLGVKRDKFFSVSSITSIVSFYITAAASYLVVTTIGGLDFDVVTTLLNLLLLLSNLLLLLGTAWLLAETISRMELASGIYIVLFNLLMIIFRDSDHEIFKVLYPALQSEDPNPIFSVALPLILGIVFMFLSFKINQKREIEI